MKTITAACILAALGLAPLRAEDAITAGQFIVEPPTLICLGFEWKISGDDNRNASVQLSYRKAGETAWKEALPLLRVSGERVFRAAEQLEYTTQELFAGSVLDLEPATDYEARLTLRDPNGVRGAAVETAKVRTRGEPKAAEGGRVLQANPSSTATAATACSTSWRPTTTSSKDSPSATPTSPSTPASRK